MPRTVVYRAGGFTNCGIGYTKFSQKELAERRDRAMTENEAIARFKSCQENVGKCEKCRFYSCCGIYDMEDTAIKALEEVQQYRVIGTLEECQAAVEKQTARKGIREKIKKGYNRGKHHYYCPVCYEKGDLRNKYNVGLYCSDCGQKLDWGDEE